VNPLFDAAREIERFCRARGWQCCVIGGLAVQRWGDPRQTRDVDLTLLTGLGSEARYVDPLLAGYKSRIPDARAFALQHRVVLVETSAGIPLDISLAALPFEARVIGRASLFELEAGHSVTTCSAEDLIVLKAFADRPQDWLDIEGIVVRQRPRLDETLIFDELGPLLELKEDPDPEAKLHAIFRKHR
jgi:hypothetical protein